LQRNHRWKAYWTKELDKGPEEGNILNTWSSGRDIQLKTPAGKMKMKSRRMDRLCESSWTGAHENFQVKEYDVEHRQQQASASSANAFLAHVQRCLNCFEVGCAKHK
jgi:hypothetical protein